MSRLKPPDIPYASNFKIPDWAGKPQPGLHLDVLKDNKMIQKLMIDEKSCYLFGRNGQMCDFIIDHQSCSRLHGALVWHKELARPFLIDVGSVHGTFIGSVRLEVGKPTPVPIDSKLHFGASTRFYVIRERIGNGINRSQLNTSENEEMDFVSSLPEDETELDNLTEFNTAQNRRNTSVMNVQETNANNRKPRTSLYIHFSDQEEVINPEDVDPSIGRFRNLAQETFIPNKRQKLSVPEMNVPHYKINISLPNKDFNNIDQPIHNKVASIASQMPQSNYPGINPTYTAAVKLGIHMPNLAADTDKPTVPIKSTYPFALYSDKNEIVDADEQNADNINTNAVNFIPSSIKLPKQSRDKINAAMSVDNDEPRKKKYAKEAWPGRKPGSFGSIAAAM